MRSKLHPILSRTLFLGGALAATSAAAISPADLAARLARSENIMVIDVRSAIAYANGHIPGAMNMPLDLLPYKPLPAGRQVIVYGDGLGVVDEAQALAVIRAKQGINADLLEGGYISWLAETRISTVPPGVGPERLPGITYDQLMAAGKGDMVLVDLRTPESAAPAGSSKARQVAASAPDIVTAFAAKLGVPVVASNGSVETAVARAQSASVKTATAPARAAAPAAGGSSSGRLLVLVADSDAAANEAARRLRASGQYRFTILIGGTETIRHEGRVGLERTDGGTAAKR
jgi:rhodanese-related sulfurtransferase